MRYKKATKKVQKAIRKARKRYERSFLGGKYNSKALFTYMATANKIKSPIGPLISDGTTTSDDHGIRYGGFVG